MALLKIEIIDRPENFERLEFAWRDLSARVSTARFTQGYDWCHAGWLYRKNKDDTTLFCITAWHEDQLVAVWPFVRVMRSDVAQLEVLGAGLGEEYADILINPQFNSHDHCRQIIQALKGSADLLNFHFLTRSSVMAETLRQCFYFYHHFECSAFMIDATSTSDIDTHMKRYSSHFRKEVNRKMKTLSSLGRIQFAMAGDERESEEIIEWLMKHKHDWLVKRGINRDWFSLESSMRFMQSVSRRQSADGRLGLFGLRLDGKLIAASASIVDRVGVEGMYITYDVEYAHYSPGLVLVMEQLRWAQQHGLVLDMRILEVDFKKRIATSCRLHQSFVIACSLAGALKIAPAVIWKAMRQTGKWLLPLNAYEWLKCRTRKLRNSGMHALYIAFQFQEEICCLLR